MKGTWLCLIAITSVACGGSGLPSTANAVNAYATALERKDADTLYELLNERDKVRLGRDGVRDLVQRYANEHAEHARTWKLSPLNERIAALYGYADGEQAAVVFERDAAGSERFLIDSAGAIPGGAASPTDALANLRRALSRRSYLALLRVLTPEMRRALERRVREIVDGLEHPEALKIDREATVTDINVNGGHRVRLR